MFDKIETIGHSKIQHGKHNNRIYLQKLAKEDFPDILTELDLLAAKYLYTKIFVKIPEWAVDEFAKHGYLKEAIVPGYYKGKENAVFMSNFIDHSRSVLLPERREKINKNIQIAVSKNYVKGPDPRQSRFSFKKLEEPDVPKLAEVYKKVFHSYPFPIFDEDYLRETMDEDVDYFGAFQNGELVAASSAEIEPENKNVEMTDFATLPEFRGNQLALYLLEIMENEMRKREIKTLYTIARAFSTGMNVTFAKKGYIFGGTLINNTDISGQIESMNVWFKHTNN